MTPEELRNLAPDLPDEAIEVMLAAIEAGEATIRTDGNNVPIYDDPLFGPPVEVRRLAYDRVLGLTVE